METCSAKHTRPQIPDKDWHCPKCGATDSWDKGFVIEMSDIHAADDCELLHEADEIHCWNCGGTTTGKKLAAAYAKQQDLKPCPTCQGTGYIKSSE